MYSSNHTHRISVAFNSEVTVGGDFNYCSSNNCMHYICTQDAAMGLMFKPLRLSDGYTYEDQCPPHSLKDNSLFMSLIRYITSTAVEVNTLIPAIKINHNVRYFWTALTQSPQFYSCHIFKYGFYWRVATKDTLINTLGFSEPLSELEGQPEQASAQTRWYWSTLGGYFSDQASWRSLTLRGGLFGLPDKVPDLWKLCTTQGKYSSHSAEIKLRCGFLVFYTPILALLYCRPSSCNTLKRFWHLVKFQKVQ